MILAATKKLAENASSVGKGGSAVRSGTKNDSVNDADKPFAISVRKYLAVDNQGFYDQSAHAVCNEKKRAHAKARIGKVKGEIACPLLDCHSRLPESRESGGISNSPDATIRQVFSQFFRPKEMPWLSFLAMSPCAM
ncbi:MAG: hypothetical protein ACLQU4_04335 [Limisphaerales bacterium]